VAAAIPRHQACRDCSSKTKSESESATPSTGKEREQRSPSFPSLFPSKAVEYGGNDRRGGRGMIQRQRAFSPQSQQEKKRGVPGALARERGRNRNCFSMGKEPAREKKREEGAIASSCPSKEKTTPSCARPCLARTEKKRGLPGQPHAGFKGKKVSVRDSCIGSWVKRVKSSFRAGSLVPNLTSFSEWAVQIEKGSKHHSGRLEGARECHCCSLARALANVRPVLKRSAFIHIF